MSTAKILIYKFGDGSNFKSLYVTIPEDGDDAGIRFSEWTEGDILHKKRESEKSSRLVVKIVSGEESKRIHLDDCAKEINGSDSSRISNVESTGQVMRNKTPTVETFSDKTNHINLDTINQTQVGALHQNTQFVNNLNFTNPLEHSLKKVKENNARIMENIHILNRTLNYTKKKEILHIICPKSIRTFPCNECGKCFVYETGLRRHYSLRHAISEVQPRWQIVWTCIQCFQVWPRQDQASLHSAECCSTIISNQQELVREIKTSLLLQCEFCEKVFTSIPRLLRHSKMHTTDKNYECVPCGLTFISYKIAEQHWPVCLWQKMFYTFSLPKMLLCNACDRKFRNYEQLYIHRYKMGHLMTKMHNFTVQSMGVLVYQCELCGKRHNSLQQIISHRSHHHPFDIGIANNDSMTNERENYYNSAENEYYLNQHLKS